MTGSTNQLRWDAWSSQTVTCDGVTLAPDGVALLPGRDIGSVTSAPIAIPMTSREVIASWQGRAPAGTTIEIEVRADVGSGADHYWTRWWCMGIWSEDDALRRSVTKQADADGAVRTDTLALTRAAQGLQWRATFRRAEGGTTPHLWACTLALSPGMATSNPVVDGVGPLPVPQLSQMAYPGGGAVWCSPTALTMVLAYWGAVTGDPRLAPFADPSVVTTTVAPAVYDPVYDGTGNWPFNTAYAATLGLDATVARMPDLAALHRWLAAGVPVVASVRWKPGELDGAPIPSSDGHLVVVTGFTPQGDPIVNDPRAEPLLGARVQRVYRAGQFANCWHAAGRTVYLIYPPRQVSESLLEGMA